MENKHFDRTVAKALAAETRRDSAECPDDNVLAAYLEFRLSAAERQQFEAHASSCGSCQEALALALRVNAGDSEAGTLEPGGETKRVLFRISVPVSALALIVVVVGVALLVPRIGRWREAPTRAAVSRREAAVSSQPPESGTPKTAVVSGQPPAAGRPKPVPGKPQFAAGELPTADRAQASARGSTAQAERQDLEVSRLAGISGEERAARLRPLPAVGTQSAEGPAQPAAEAARFDAAGQKLETRDQPSTAIVRQSAPVPSPSSKDTLAKTKATSMKAALVSQKQEGPVKVGDRTFVRQEWFLEDEESTRHPELPLQEILPDSDEFRAILEKFPELEKLRGYRLPVVLYWEGKRVVLRW